MVWNNIPRVRCFSLGDFHDYDRCEFLFLVRHHLEKKYELAEGSEKMAVGTILDVVIKKIHSSKAYDQSLNYILKNIFAATILDIKNEVTERGKKSFYGSVIEFLTPEVILIAKDAFKYYYLQREGKINKGLPYKDFWECIIGDENQKKIWGGPDALELGDDGVPEIIDYKYLEDTTYLDMDTMPKLYTLLCATELSKLGYKKVRFRVRLWREPLNEDMYEEFDLDVLANLKDYFGRKIDQILSSKEIRFCDRDYCKVCNSNQRQTWIDEIRIKFDFD